MDLFILVIELIGTVAFALSGALVAIERRLDFFGIAVLAVTTAVGGGITRDLILGNTPPTAFVSPIYLLFALLTAFAVMVMLSLRIDFIRSEKYLALLPLISTFDALGLGIFTVIGARTAILTGNEDNLYLVVFVGLLTGVGGGMLRDVLVSRTPLVLRREIYAVAAIIGAVGYFFLRMLLPDVVALLIGAAIVTVIRLLALKFKLNLPLAR